MKYIKYITLFSLALLLGASSGGAPTDVYLPNMRTMPKSLLQNAYIRTDSYGQQWMYCGINAGSIGPGNFLVVGSRPNTNGNTMKLKQAVWDKTNREWISLPHDAGEIFWTGPNHPCPNRWMGLGWAKLVSVKLSDASLPVYWSEKQPFCLQNSLSMPISIPAPGQPTLHGWPRTVTVDGKVYGMGCLSHNANALSVGQRVSAGFADRYGPGVNPPVKLWGDGIYAVGCLLDPDNQIKEWYEDDNFCWAIFRLVGTTITPIAYGITGG